MSMSPRQPKIDIGKPLKLPDGRVVVPRKRLGTTWEFAELVDGVVTSRTDWLPEEWLLMHAEEAI